MVLDRGLAAAGDEDQLLDPGVARLVDRILVWCLVEALTHFLRQRRGGRQEPGPEATDGEDRLTHGYGHGVLSRRPPDRRNAPGYRSNVGARATALASPSSQKHVLGSVDLRGEPGRPAAVRMIGHHQRSEEHTSELQSLMRISYAVFCLKKKNKHTD